MGRRPVCGQVYLPTINAQRRNPIYHVDAPWMKTLGGYHPGRLSRPARLQCFTLNLECYGKTITLLRLSYMEVLDDDAYGPCYYDSYHHACDL